MVKEWLDKDTRRAGSIVIPVQSVGESPWRRSSAAPGTSAIVSGADAGDGRHAHLGKRTIGRSMPRPERLGLPVGIHAGSILSQPADPRSAGVRITSRIHRGRRRRSRSQLTSLIVEGVFARHPNLKNGDAGIRLHLAAVLSVAAAQVLARGADWKPPWVGIARRWRCVRGNIRFSLPARSTRRRIPRH